LVPVTSKAHKRHSLVPALLEWFSRSARDLPWRETQDPYAIWVSEIMLQQTQVQTVLPYWRRWMKALPDIPSLAKASPEMIHKLWEGLGYYSRVRNLQKAAQLILDQHGGRFPEEHAQVLELPGIGPYTAGAICSTAFNQPTPILDGNVMRVLSRLYAIPGDPRGKAANARLWELARELVETAAIEHRKEERACSHLNQSLMELGALVCTPKQPDCARCPVAELCVAKGRNQVGDFPAIAPRAKVTARRFAAFVLEREGRFCVGQRPGGVVNAHLWEFPNVELPVTLEAAGSRVGLLSAAQAVLGFKPEGLEPVYTLKHSITRYRITLEAYRVVSAGWGRLVPSSGLSLNQATGDEPIPSHSHGSHRWGTLRELSRLPFTGAHKKILHALRHPLKPS
jgi:A/G-specific adenine glycosylase